jgi:plastocyanin
MRRSAAAAAALLLLAACGSDEPPPVPSGPPASEVRIGMQEYRFQLSAGVLDPGPVTVSVTNAGSTGHDVVLVQGEETLGSSDVLSPGGRQTLEIKVAPGLPVHLECTVGGHSAAGMHTTIAVGDGDG